MSYKVNCEGGVCTAKIEISLSRAYVVPEERQAPWVRERAKNSPHGYLGYGLNIETRQVDKENRTALFVASTDSSDRYGDVIRQEGWELKNYLANPVVLFAHDSQGMPVGRAERVFVGSDGKMYVVVRFATAEQYPFADTVFRMVEGGFLSAVSVGFLPLEFQFRESEQGEQQPGAIALLGGGREYTKQELVEISVVPVPANPEALLVGKGFEKALQAVNVRDFRGGSRVERTYIAIEPAEQVDICYGLSNPADSENYTGPKYAAVSFSSQGTVRAAALKTAKKSDDAVRIAHKILEQNPGIEGVTLARAVGSIGADGGVTVFETFSQIERAGHSDVESVLFDKKKWILAKAKAWCGKHGFKSDDLQPSKEFFRFRQFPPSECQGGYKTLTENMPDGIEMIVCTRKKKDFMNRNEESTFMKTQPCGCPEEKSVVPFHHYPLADRKAAWDAAKEMGSTDSPGDWYKMCTIVTGEKKLKGSYKLPHHRGPGGKFATVLRGVGNALARLDQTQASDPDKRGARGHLMKHRAEFGDKSFSLTQFDAALADLEVMRDSLDCPEEKEVVRQAIAAWVVTLDWRVKSLVESIGQPFSDRKEVLKRIVAVTKAMSEAGSSLVPQHWSNETADGEVSDAEKPKSPTKLESANEIVSAAKREVSRTLAVARSYQREMVDRLLDIQSHVRMMPGGKPYDKISDKAGGDSDEDDVDVKGFGIRKADEPTYTGEEDMDDVKPQGSSGRKPHSSADEDARVGLGTPEEGKKPFGQDAETSQTGGEKFDSNEKPHLGDDEDARVGGEKPSGAGDLHTGEEESSRVGSGDPQGSGKLHSEEDEDARVGLGNKVSAAVEVAKSARKAVIRAHERLGSFLGELSDHLGQMDEGDLQEKPSETPRKPHSGADEDEQVFGKPSGQDAGPKPQGNNEETGNVPDPYPFPLKSMDEIALALVEETKSAESASNHLGIINSGTEPEGTDPKSVSATDTALSALEQALKDLN